MGWWPLACWNCRFESCRGHACFCCVLYNKDKGKSQDHQDKERRAEKVKREGLQKKFLVGSLEIFK
jgi:hypothetical protein